MKKAIIVLSLFLTNFIMAQEINVSIKKSNIVEEKKRKTSIAFSEPDGNGGVITVRAIRNLLAVKSYDIEHYDANLKLIKTTNFPNKFGKVLKGIAVSDGQISLIQFHFDGKTKKVFVNQFSSSIAKLEFKKSNNIITFGKNHLQTVFGISWYNFNASKAIENLNYGSIIRHENAFSTFDKDAFGQIIFSKNKKLFAIIFDIKKRENEEHIFYMFNNKFEQLYTSSFKKNIKDRLFDLVDLSIDETNQDVYLLGKSFENNSKKHKQTVNGKRVANYHFELFKMNKASSKQLNLNAKDYFIGKLKVISYNGKVSIIGFYSEKNDHRYRGICRFNINGELLTVENKTFSPFSNQFYDDKYKKGANVKKRKKELANLRLKGIFIDANDAITLVAEEYYILENISYGMQGTSANNATAFYKDIISIKIDKEGKLIWARNINKSQRTPLKNEALINTSFTALGANNQVYFFINVSDNIIRLKSGEVAFKQTTKKRSNLYVIAISEDGKINYKKLIDNEESKVWYQVISGVVLKKEKAVVLQGKKGKLKRLIKLTVQ